MSSTSASSTSVSTTAPARHHDVVVVGAGISGVGAAYHLQEQRPGTSFVVYDKLVDFGGTWRMHTYPGIRSDSDLYTFGYRFKPWTSAPIASAEEILKYMGEVIEENDLGRHIHYRHKIVHAAWDSDARLWTLRVQASDASGEVVEEFEQTCRFLWMCQGYYRQEQGYTPEWPGMDQYRGPIVHPQTWPDDLDITGKKVLVIGSGATAATLVPAIAGQTEHVTMLQRSPTYFWTGRNSNEVADMLRQLEIDETWIHEIVRRKVLFDQEAVTRLSFEAPDLLKDELIKNVRTFLGDEYPVEKHFMPSYRPWQQRLAFIPDGDLFQGISSGKASVVTDEIETFNETGVLTKGGEQLDADVIVTATGFDLSVLGDIPFTIDGRELAFHETITYRGTMFTGIPNMAWVFGYFRASWTLRADLIADFVCHLLDHMDELGATMVVPALRPQDEALEVKDWLDPENFNPGYMQRSMHLLPKRLDLPEWQHTQDYWLEKDSLPNADLDDGCLRFS
ncbi:MAG: flavin-containing monooxygenase [Ilumatobacteraceae bacterium]